MTRLTKPDESIREQLTALIPRLRRFTRVLTGNPSDPDDVVQAYLEKAMLNLDKWQPETRLDAWVLRIARNAWLDDRRRAHNLAGHDDIADLLDLAGDDGRAITEASSDARRVRPAVDALCLLIGTVMSRLSRAKAALARQMSADRTVQ
jgi:RNA polymerase sigma-70 factor (ECF subfamily)